MTFPGTTGSSTANGCPTTGGASGALGLDLPVGAHIDTISAWVFDDGSTNAYTVSAYLHSLTATDLDATLVGIASGGSSTTFGIATIDLSPSVDTTIVAGDSLRLIFSTAAGSNGFCGVTVEYTLPPL